jgi:hypothetical protein
MSRFATGVGETYASIGCAPNFRWIGAGASKKLKRRRDERGFKNLYNETREEYND